MKRLFTLVLVASAAVVSASAQVSVEIFSGHSTTGGGTPYSGLVGSFNSPDIMFATDTGFNWHPFSQNAFGADLKGVLDVSVSGAYQFSLNSDDGSLLFIDGVQIIDNGGPHGPNTVNGSTALTAGLHPFEVRFYEDFGGSSGVDLTLPTGVTYAASTAPDASSTCGLFAGALVALSALARRIRA